MRTGELARQAGVNIQTIRQIERVIVNETGLDGDFDFTLDFYAR